MSQSNKYLQYYNIFDVFLQISNTFLFVYKNNKSLLILIRKNSEILMNFTGLLH